MFGKICKRCGKKLDKGYSFCPYCGFSFKEQDEKNYGMLGRDDIDFSGMGMKMPFGFNKIFSSLLKQIDKQFQQLDKEIGKDSKKPGIKPGIKSKGFSISISSGTGKEPEIKVSGFGPGVKVIRKPISEKPARIRKSFISDEKAKKLAKLPRQEAETQVRRLSSKIIYEISMPGVRSIKDVIINKLENSIEIKAFSKDKVYVKLIPLNLPILDYQLKKEKLILELKAK